MNKTILKLSVISAILFSSVAQANIYPVKGVINTNQKSFIFYVDSTNEKTTMEYNIQVQKWDAGYSYSDTKDVIVFPTKIKAVPGKKYAVKAFFKSDVKDVQQTYRVIFSHKTIDEKKVEQQLAVNFEEDVPLFVEPNTPKQITIEKKVEGTNTSFKNNGNYTLKVAKLKVNGKDIDGLTYILPSETIKIEGTDVELGEEVK